MGGAADGVAYGAHIGGFGLKPGDFEFILGRAEEIGDNWREHAGKVCFGQKDEFFLFPDDPEFSFAEEKMQPQSLAPQSCFSPRFSFSLLFHKVVFEEKSPVYKMAKALYPTIEKSRLLNSLAYHMEGAGKHLLFNCQECGDCALTDMAYLCPMSKCAKFQRNGPCGGSNIDGMCEAHSDRRCVWPMVYERLSSKKRTEEMRSDYVPPVNCKLANTSSWANFFLGRDHTAKKMAAEKAAE